MLWAITALSLLLWLLGLIASYTLGGFLHILPVIAVVAFLIQVIQGQKVRGAGMECTSSVPGPGSTPGMLLSLGFGKDLLGMCGRKKILQGIPVDGRYPALGGSHRKPMNSTSGIGEATK